MANASLRLSFNERLLCLIERVGEQLEELDACAAAADELFRRLPLRPGRRQRRQLQHLAHFIVRAAELTETTVRELDAGLVKILKELAHERLTSTVQNLTDEKLN